MNNTVTPQELINLAGRAVASGQPALATIMLNTAYVLMFPDGLIRDLSHEVDRFARRHSIVVDSATKKH